MGGSVLFLVSISVYSWGLRKTSKFLQIVTYFRTEIQSRGPTYTKQKETTRDSTDSFLRSSGAEIYSMPLYGVCLPWIPTVEFLIMDVNFGYQLQNFYLWM
jgi:hypothetical protein